MSVSFRAAAPASVLQWKASVTQQSLREHFRRNLLSHERLDNIARLEVAVILDGNAALHAAAHFTHIILESPQRADLAGMHHDVIAQQPNCAAPRKLAVLHKAASHHADLAD